MNPIDTLLAYAINSPAKFKTDKEELEYLRSTKPILRDELLTCYQFLEGVHPKICVNLHDGVE